MSSPIYWILMWVSGAMALLPLVVSLFSKAFNAQLKALLVYFILSALMELISTVGYLFELRTNNFLASNIFTILEILIIMYIYFEEFKLKNPYPMLMLGAAFLFLALGNITNKIYSDVIYGTGAVIIVMLTIVYLFRVSDNMQIPRLTNYYFFWLNAAFLFFFSVACLPFLFIDFIVRSDDLTREVLWGIQQAANIIYNILLCVGVFKSRIFYKQNQLLKA